MSSPGASLSRRAPEADLARAAVERRPERLHPRVDVHAHGQVQRVRLGGLGLVEPAAGEIERVARLQRHVEDGLARFAHRLGLVALVLERQLPGGLVDEPALLARDLE